MSKTVTLVFNYRSPFCALIVDRLFALGANSHITLKWKIVREVPRPSSLPITTDNPRFGYNRQDCDRRAKWLRLPWNPPAWRLGKVAYASLVGQYLLDAGLPNFAPYTIRINRAYWCHGLNADDIAVVRTIALETGVAEPELSKVDALAQVLERELTDNQCWCEQEGVLGVPFFLVDNERFWGSDRFAALVRYLTESGCGPFDPRLTQDLC